MGWGQRKRYTDLAKVGTHRTMVFFFLIFNGQIIILYIFGV
jgi:hypothetical protein